MNGLGITIVIILQTLYSEKILSLINYHQKRKLGYIFSVSVNIIPFVVYIPFTYVINDNNKLTDINEISGLFVALSYLLRIIDLIEDTKVHKEIFTKYNYIIMMNIIIEIIIVMTIIMKNFGIIKVQHLGKYGEIIAYFTISTFYMTLIYIREIKDNNNIKISVNKTLIHLILILLLFIYNFPFLNSKINRYKYSELIRILIEKIIIMSDVLLFAYKKSINKKLSMILSRNGASICKNKKGNSQANMSPDRKLSNKCLDTTIQINNAQDFITVQSQIDIHQNIRESINKNIINDDKP